MTRLPHAIGVHRHVLRPASGGGGPEVVLYDRLAAFANSVFANGGLQANGDPGYGPRSVGVVFPIVLADYGGPDGPALLLARVHLHIGAAQHRRQDLDVRLCVLTLFLSF